MSFGNGYNGGRTRMKTKVLLNVYDLSPANEYLYPVGFGVHHCGIEIGGREYSYGSGGGIFDGPPKYAPGAKFRTQLDMGSYDGGQQELNRALDDMRHNGGFGPNGYHLVKRNCNHFCNALVWRLLRRQIPPHINRLADIGNCCSCLLPKKLLEDSPVGGDGNGNNTSSSSSSSPFAVPTRATMNRGGGGRAEPNAFSGKGHSLSGGTTGGTTSSSTSTSSSDGIFSKLIRPSQKSRSSSSSSPEDLTDRRERARKAALARLERNQQQQQQQQPQQ